MPAPAPPSDPAPSGGPNVAVIALAVVLLAGGGALGWWLLAGPSPAPKKGEVRTPTVGLHPYVAAEHVDGSGSRLVPGDGGKGVLEVVLRDVMPAEKIVATLRQGSDPKAPMVFLDRAGAAAAPPGAPGVLEVESLASKEPSEARLSIRLPTMPDRVTVVDLRWKGGRWEGFEVAATGK